MELRLSSKLRDECRTLLSRLDELDHRDHFCTTLRDRYNQIIDAHWTSPLSDPLISLPPEICTQIFEEATLGPHSQVDNALLLSTVSSSWLNYLASLPSLWTRIVISDRIEDNMARVAACLTLSRERKISISILTPKWMEYMEMLAPHTNRIKSILLEDFDGALRLTESLGYLPALTFMGFSYSLPRIYDGEKGIIQLMDNAPSLTSLGQRFLTPSILQHPRATQLTTIWTRLTFYELVRILSTSMMPLQLSISDLRFHIPLGDESVNIEYDPRTSINVSSLQLPSFSPTVGKLLGHSIRGIRSLTVGISTGHELGKLLFILGSLKVEKLSLDISMEVGPILTRSDYAVLNSLRDLTISSVTFKSLDSLIEIIPTIMPQLASFDIQDIRLGKAIHYVGQLQHLQNLDVFLDRSMVGLKGPIYFRNLIELALEMESPFGLDFMEARKLTYIRTTARADPDSDTLPMSYIIPASSFSTLTSINIKNITSQLRLDSLPQLQKLEFWWNSTKVWGCDLLEQLVYAPRTCPHLKYIVINARLIEWDVVLLMLLRRNFLHDKTISRIRAMTFPNQLPIPLVWTISNLLRCRLLPGLDVGEFSLERVAKILFGK
ncbi:hypothetical protein FRC17_002756 [Serendipita sp. 399]|nr:hypothetical protein FRC17_002756 [Serendipita sp. 399]